MGTHERVFQPPVRFGNLGASDINGVEPADAEAEESSDVGGLCDGHVVCSALSIIDIWRIVRLIRCAFQRLCRESV